MQNKNKEIVHKKINNAKCFLLLHKNLLSKQKPLYIATVKYAFMTESVYQNSLQFYDLYN